MVYCAPAVLYIAETRIDFFLACCYAYGQRAKKMTACVSIAARHAVSRKMRLLSVPAATVGSCQQLSTAVSVIVVHLIVPLEA